MSGRRHDTIAAADPDWMAEHEARIAQQSARVSRELSERAAKRKALDPSPVPAPPPLYPAPPPPPTPAAEAKRPARNAGAAGGPQQRCPVRPTLPPTSSPERPCPASAPWPGGLARLWPDPNRVREEWARVVVALEDPDLELTVEEFSPVLAAFNAMLSIGHTFDPALVAIVRILERQATGGEEDGDADDADRLLSEKNSSWAILAATNAEEAGVNKV